MSAHDAKSFDWVAENIFAPIYPEIAQTVLQTTGIHQGRLLDIGCGGGHLGLAVLEAAPYMTGLFVDNNSDAVTICTHRIDERSLQARACAVLGDVAQLPFAAGTFDLIVSRGSLPFWDDVPRAFSEILRVLRPTGQAYLGGGIGSAKYANQIREKMRVFDPGWPHNLPVGSQGHRQEDYIAAFEELGADYEVLQDSGGGTWCLVCRGSNMNDKKADI